MEDYININHPKFPLSMTRRNYRKYHTFCTVLDYLSTCDGICGLKTVSMKSLIDVSLRCCYIFKCRKNREEVNTWIAEMKWMGLIEAYVPEGPIELSLTEKGKEAYSSQTFHSVFSNLIEAKMSRRIAIVAVTIAIVSLFISLLC